MLLFSFTIRNEVTCYRLSRVLGPQNVLNREAYTNYANERDRMKYKQSWILALAFSPHAFGIPCERISELNFMPIEFVKSNLYSLSLAGLHTLDVAHSSHAV